MTGLLAAFMAGMAANVSARSTPSSPTTSWRAVRRPGEPDDCYLRIGRIVTVAGVLVAIGTAFIASGYTNIMDYIQLLFSFFNAPLFATFIIGMFWKRATPWAGFCGPRRRHGRRGRRALPAHVGRDRPRHRPGRGVLGRGGGVHAPTPIVTVGVSLVTQPKPVEQLQGLVHGMANEDESTIQGGRRRGSASRLLAVGALGLTVLVSLVFS